MKRPGAFKKVLAPFCTDMKKLASEEGVTLDLDGEPFVLRAILTNLTADTLAAHDLLGFLSVGANYFCRRCMVSRAEVRANANAVGIPRTPELHAAHLEQVQQRKKFSSECGVKRSCPLDDIPYFHCVENNVFDAFHDLLEGVVPLVIKLVLRHYITKRKFFNVKFFNGLVVSFDYGLPDSKNKPSPNFDLDMLTSPRGKLKQTGSQMWFLMRALPFILGDLVEEGDPHMNLIFLLQDIMQIIFSFEIQNGDADRLDTLIYNHNALFFTLFIETQELHEEEDEQGLDEQEVDGADNEQGVVTQDVDEEDNQKEVHEQEVEGEDSEQGVDEEELVEEEGLLKEETEQEQTVGKSARNKNKKNNKKKKNSKKKKKKV
ncbi:uncharacterized protein LOC117648681 [Thrips palmi]|uniref:Uncharacterized protein LOC117648681 n=1 Tax=Thrips palmi TaxID=161013 RepID=A0A6P8Z9F3_THRPL|nr:uncharacterized protein LOC117648681 [Thrips palmi]XP_034247250.1 uncharacterized protein LOC117648681 [Thrips palmi]